MVGTPSVAATTDTKLDLHTLFFGRLASLLQAAIVLATQVTNATLKWVQSKQGGSLGGEAKPSRCRAQGACATGGEEVRALSQLVTCHRHLICGVIYHPIAAVAMNATVRSPPFCLYCCLSPSQSHRRPPPAPLVGPVPLRRTSAA